MATTNLGRIGFVLKGDWSAGTYKNLDIVFHTGATWGCQVLTTTEEPGVGSDWVKLLEESSLINDNSVTLLTTWSSSKIDTDLGTKVARTSSTGSAALPSGTDAQRDVSPVAGYTRHNATGGVLETYLTSWQKVFTASDATTAATADKLVMRGATGTVKAADGVDADDVATMSQIVSQDYVDGTLVITPATDADITLTSEQALFGRIVLNTGAWTTARNIIVPDAEKMRVVKVAGTYAATVKTAAGSGVVVISGQEAALYCDGTNVDYQTKRELNAAGDAPIFACRAWVNFDGTGTVAIRASGNVSSITDNGTSDYTVNFTTAMADADYAVVSSGWTDIVAVNTTSVRPRNAAAYQTSSIRLISSSTAGGTTTGSDFSLINVAIFR